LKREKLVSVFRTGSSAVLSVAKSLLDEAGILYKIQSEHLQAADSDNSIEILVFNNDEKSAKSLLSNIDKAEKLMQHPNGHPHTKSDQYYSSMAIAVVSILCILIVFAILLAGC
jgi:subtilase family serine protease